MGAIRVGKPDTKPEAPSHVEGVMQGNAKGNYEKMPGHLPDGRRTAASSTGVGTPLHEPIDNRMPNLPPP
jgi:hypothetical protein